MADYITDVRNVYKRLVIAEKNGKGIRLTADEVRSFNLTWEGDAMQFGTLDEHNLPVI